MSDSIPPVAILRDRSPQTPKLNKLVFRHPYIFSKSTGYTYTAMGAVALVMFLASPTVMLALMMTSFLLLSMTCFTLAKRKQNLIDRGDIIYIPRYYGELGVWQKNLRDYVHSLERLRLGALKSPEVESAYHQVEPLAWDNIVKATRAVRALHNDDTFDSNTKGQFQRDLAQLMESEKQIEQAHQAANGIVLEKARAIIDPEPERQVATNINAQLSALRQLESGD